MPNATAIPGTLDTTARGSHRITRSGSNITIHALELFSGFDADVDGKNSRIAKFDDTRIRRIVETTNKLAARGQTPKLILGHTPDAPDGKPEEPSFGDIDNLRFTEIGSAPGIVGDVTMSAPDFETFIQSNRYPRRSAEIFGDTLASVALLGANKPARPLPDTKFSQAHDGEAEQFTRWTPELRMEVYKMADKNDTPTVESLAKEVSELKAANKTLLDENESLKASATRIGEDADKYAQLEKANQTLLDAVSAMESKMAAERIGNRLVRMADEGFHVGAPDDETRERFAGMFDPKDESKWDDTEKFIRETVKRDPLQTIVGKAGAVGPEGDPDPEKMQAQERKAAENTVKRMADEEIDPSKFSQILTEERNKLKGTQKAA